MKVWDLDEEFNIIQSEQLNNGGNKKMENEIEQTNLDKGIGTQEMQSLKPIKLKIKNVEIKEVGDKKNEILKCLVKHPDKEEDIEISQAKYEKNKELKVTALWVNLDEAGEIQKGSALATLLETAGVKTSRELIGKRLILF